MIGKLLSFAKKYPMLLVTVVLCLLFFKFNSNLKKEFKQIDAGYKDKSVVNLVKGLKTEDLSYLLFTSNYVSDQKDADFIAQQIVTKLNDGKKLPNLYELNKQAFQVSTTLADNLGGDGLKKRIETSYEVLGIDSVAKIMQNEVLPNTIRIDNGSGKIIVDVQKIDTTANKIFKRLKLRKEKPISGVLVQIKEHYYDLQRIARDSILGYAKTNEQGLAIFERLDTTCYYSVLPIRKGFEYGSAQGTVNGNLGIKSGGEQKFTFRQKEHTIRLFDNLTYQQIREDNTITVRSPADFKSDLVKYLILFFIAWWGLYFIMLWRKKNFSRGVISLLMLLTGLCLLTMFSIHNPLTDKMLGKDTWWGIMIGVTIIGIFQWVDFIKFFQNNSIVKFDFLLLQFINWLFKPFRVKVKPFATILGNNRIHGFVKFGALIILIVLLPLLILDLLQITRLSNYVERLEKWSLRKLLKGLSYLFVALLLTILLLTPLGSAVGGMRVNLDFFLFSFQPSEITKYLIVIFMAAFFYKNTDKIIKYSEVGNSSLFRSKIKVLLWILCGLGGLLGIYIYLGDMGPALVLGVTFILLYSIVKSKVRFEKKPSEGIEWEKILTCDIAVLIYGVSSFIAMLIIGNKMDYMGVFCLLWFAAWIVLGLTRRKQIFESAIFMNLVIAAFIFGGTLLAHTPFEKLQDVGKRLDGRTEMCVNTWGTLGLNDNEEQKAGENSQVAQGLWGLASGGVWGQGLGEGNPNLIPAFHTDMILESIGEQMGWVGLLVIVLCLSLLLRKSIVIGFRAMHPFVFYLAIGIAIVTGVQFLIIALGSTGIIPLTGVTVPFFSYGKVGIILNLAAFGIVLSLSQKCEKEVTEQQEENIESYNYPISITSCTYCLLAIFVLGVFSYYQLWNRNKTLTHCAFVNTVKGEPVIEYNPRIALLMKKLHSGNIYDKNGVILATNDENTININDYINKYGVNKEEIEEILKKRTQRYYPFGDNLFFMLGDYNTKVLFSYREENPVGYLADAQHLATLRGFDNIKYDNVGNPLKIDLKTTKYRSSKFLYRDTMTRKGVVLRDYSDKKFLSMLKNGINSKEVEKWNEDSKRKKRDIYLTIDAGLQTKIQTAINDYATENFKGDAWNKLRISVVVLNAKNGELLTSANYPLPDQKILKEKLQVDKYYSDNKTDRSFKAYTDRDLGLTYQTAPGSTAKVMSALAGFQKSGIAAGNKAYYIDKREVIEPPTIEPNFQKDKHNTTMEEAIRLSSNCYFINLVNDNNLYKQLDSIYEAVGIRIGNMTPYFFNYEIQNEKSKNFKKLIDSIGRIGESTYNNYIEKRNASHTDSSVYKKMNNAEWQWAWGQGNMDASPLNMARVVSIVANGGKMPETKFILKGNKDLKVPEKMPFIKIVSENEANTLKRFMNNESKKHRDKHNYAFPANMGGKTGTPERVITYTGTAKVYNKAIKQYENKIITVLDKMNDGWYIFFIDSHREKAPLAIAVRMERLADGNSGTAVRLTNKVILKVLQGACQIALRSFFNARD